MYHTDLYFIETRTNEKRQFLCNLVEHFFEREKKVQVIADSTKAAEDLDSLLWMFSKTSFLPHSILSSDELDSAKERIVITEGEKLLESYEILVYDGTLELEFTKNYPAAIHFVLKDDTEKTQESRGLYNSARDQGLHVHHIPYSPVTGIKTVLEKLDL